MNVDSNMFLSELYENRMYLYKSHGVVLEHWYLQ